MYENWSASVLHVPSRRTEIDPNDNSLNDNYLFPTSSVLFVLEQRKCKLHAALAEYSHETLAREEAGVQVGTPS